VKSQAAAFEDEALRPVVAELKVPTFDGHLNESNTDLRRCSMEYTPRRKLTREFKLEAVRQVALSEKPKAQLARELGVRVGQLRTWRLEFEKEAVTGIAKPDRSAAEDLEQLRRENAKLKMEIEILKKAAIYFAREAK
jgi:transposase